MKRVLVCEDEDSIREFVVINLVRSGYEVVLSDSLFVVEAVLSAAEELSD